MTDLLLDQVSFRAALADPCARDEAQVAAAVRAGDHEAAAVRALVLAKLELDLPAELVETILPGIDDPVAFLGLIGQATGDKVGAVETLITTGKLCDDLDGRAQTVLALFALWRLEPSAEIRLTVVPRLRRLVRRPLPREVHALASWLVTETGDPDAQRLLGEHSHVASAAAQRAAAEVAGSWLDASVDAILARLPERLVDPPLPGVPVRVAPKAGRNEPCPCGSGKKFKRCCEGETTRPASAVTRDQQLIELAPRLQPDQLAELTRRDLCHLDLRRLRSETLIEVFRSHLAFRDWARAEQVIEALADAPFVDDYRVELVDAVMDAGDLWTARAMIEKLADADALAEVRMALALHGRDPDALGRLGRAAQAAVADPTGVAAIELAHAVLSVEPALGILLARGCVTADRLLDAEVLVERIEEARDALLVPPGDPALETYDLLSALVEGEGEDEARAPEQAALAKREVELERSVEEKASRLATIQQELTANQRELERARAEATAVRSRAAEDPERRELRRKVEEYEARIREGNEERADLRRQLERGEPRARAAPRRHSPDAEPEPDVEELQEVQTARRPVVPTFSARAVAALEAAGDAIAAIAMRRIGSLAAGDASGWAQVKQLKDMPRQVLAARVGIHYRLLFRCEGGALDVLDVVSREGFLTTVKHLRATL